MTSTDELMPTAGASLPPTTVGARPAAAAGVVAAGVALAVGELGAGLFASMPSLTTAVGQLFIPLTPEWLKDIAIALFDTADKPVFVGGVVVVTLLVGAWVGVRARTDRMPALLTYVGFALFGMFAALQAPAAGALVVVPITLLAAAGGLASLTWLLGLAAGPVAGPAAEDVGDAGSAPVVDTEPTPAASVPRRSLLGATVTLGVLAAAGATVGAQLRRLRLRDVVQAPDVALPAPTVTAPALTPATSIEVPGITPVVVPNADFYRIDTALGTPFVDAATWELSITGMVERPITLTYEDLLAGEVVERYVTLSCVSNEVGDDLVGNALWRGVLLAPLLEQAGVEPGAGQVVGRSVDGWTAGFPVEAVFDRDTMIAFGMNGEPLPPAHGFPARLVVPGLYGYVSATKWLREIELTTWEGVDGYWIPRGWAKEGPIKTQSRIDVPQDGARVVAGPTVVAGVAWAGRRGVTAVEVRRTGETDGPWVQAEVTEPLGEATWVQWRAELDLPEGTSTLQVRATDGEGRTQSPDPVPPRPDGAEGWHTIRVFT